MSYYGKVLFVMNSDQDLAVQAPHIRSNSAPDRQLSLALKERVLDGFEGDPWLVDARIAIIGWLERNPGHSATIDIVYKLVGPPPRQNLPGAVFHIGSFKRVGYTTTKKLHGHGNPIGMWRLSSASAAARGPRQHAVTSPARAAAEPEFERRE